MSHFRSLSSFSLLSLLLTACAPGNPASTPATIQPSVLPSSNASSGPPEYVIGPISSPSPQASPSITVSTKPSAPASSSAANSNIVTLPNSALDLASGSTPASLRFRLAGNAVTLKPNQQLCLPLLQLDSKQQPLKDNYELRWASSASDIASIDNSGCIKTLKNGESTITVEIPPPLALKTTLQVKVSDQNPASAGSANKPKFDFNGDGQRDWLIGSGGTYRLYLGQGEAFPAENPDPSRSIVLEFPNQPGPNPNPFFATSTAVGDLNGDGLDDIAIGHAFASTNSSGEVAVIFGHQHPFNHYQLKNAELKIMGRTAPAQDPKKEYALELLGKTVFISDLDQDGRQDLIVSHAGHSGLGAVHVYSGREKWPAQLSTNEASFNLTGSTPAAKQGSAGFAYTAAIGDFDGNGWPDLAVGQGRSPLTAELSLKDPLYPAGAVHIFFGGPQSWRNKTALEADYRLEGVEKQTSVNPYTKLDEYWTEIPGYRLATGKLTAGKADSLILYNTREVQTIAKASGNLSAMATKHRLRAFSLPESIQPSPSGSEPKPIKIDTVKQMVFDVGYNYYRPILLAGDFDADGLSDILTPVTLSNPRLFVGLTAYLGSQASADEVPAAGTLIVERSQELMPDFALIDKLSGGMGSELIIRDERRPEALCFFRASAPFSGGFYYEQGNPVCLP